MIIKKKIMKKQKRLIGRARGKQQKALKNIKKSSKKVLKSIPKKLVSGIDELKL